MCILADKRNGAPARAEPAKLAESVDNLKLVF